MTKTSPAESSFALYVDQSTQALCFWQGAQMMAALASMAAQQSSVYEPTESSARATRGAMGAQGFAPLLTSRPKLTAAERARAEAKAEARRWGFDDGRSVGGAR